MLIILNKYIFDFDKYILLRFCFSFRVTLILGRMGHDRCQGSTKREHCVAQQSTSNVAQNLMSLEI